MATARSAQSASSKTPGTQGKRVEFDLETWQTLDVLARERMMTFQELADEAFRDLLKKHGRPMDMRDAFKRSAQAADTAKAAKRTPEKQKPAGGRRARSKRSSS